MAEGEKQTLGEAVREYAAHVGRRAIGVEAYRTARERGEGQARSYAEGLAAVAFPALMAVLERDDIYDPVDKMLLGVPSALCDIFTDFLGVASLGTSFALIKPLEHVLVPMWIDYIAPHMDDALRG